MDISPFNSTLTTVSRWAGLPYAHGTAGSSAGRPPRAYVVMHSITTVEQVKSFRLYLLHLPALATGLCIHLKVEAFWLRQKDSTSLPSLARIYSSAVGMCGLAFLRKARPHIPQLY